MSFYDPEFKTKQKKFYEPMRPLHLTVPYWVFSAAQERAGNGPMADVIREILVREFGRDRE